MTKTLIERLRQEAIDRSYGDIAKVLHTADILHSGWEMDTEAWIVEMSDGTTEALATDHGGLYFWSREEAEQKLCETEASAASIRKALTMWPKP